MKCPKCNETMIVENLDTGGKTKRLRCQSCGYCEVKDNKNRKLLTDDMPTPPDAGRVIGG